MHFHTDIVSRYLHNSVYYPHYSIIHDIQTCHKVKFKALCVISIACTFQNASFCFSCKHTNINCKRLASQRMYIYSCLIFECQISDKSRYVFLWPLNISILLTQIIPPKLSLLILDDPAKSLLSQWPRHILSILGSFYWHGLTDIGARISNYSNYFFLCDKITNPCQ